MSRIGEIGIIEYFNVPKSIIIVDEDDTKYFLCMVNIKTIITRSKGSVSFVNGFTPTKLVVEILNEKLVNYQMKQKLYCM